MIVGSHVIIYSRDDAADRAFLRDVLKLPYVDVGGGWLIFGLPPSEVAIHPTEGAASHAFYLMCQDVEAFIQAMRARSLVCTPVRDERWGLLTELTLPGGGKLGVYQPRHARPKPARATTVRRAQQKKRPRKARRRPGVSRKRRAKR
jgi:hypothetical protein